MKTTSTKTISQAVAETAERLMKHVGRFDAPDVVSCVRANYPLLVAQQERHLADQAMLRQAKLWLRHLEADDEEGDVPALPGMGLPRAIAVPKPDGSGHYYVAAALATWRELQAGLEERQVNKIRVEAALNAYIEEMARVRPLMESDPTLTYGEACERLGVDA